MPTPHLLRVKGCYVPEWAKDVRCRGCAGGWQGAVNKRETRTLPEATYAPVI